MRSRPPEAPRSQGRPRHRGCILDPPGREGESAPSGARAHPPKRDCRGSRGMTKQRDFEKPQGSVIPWGQPGGTPQEKSPAGNSEEMTGSGKLRDRTSTEATSEEGRPGRGGPASAAGGDLPRRITSGSRGSREAPGSRRGQGPPVGGPEGAPMGDTGGSHLPGLRGARVGGEGRRPLQLTPS